MAKYITPAVTPFLEDGKIDEKGAAALYEFLVKGGVDGILVFGSIGEFFAVSTEEKKKLISLAIRQINGRIPVIIGTADMILENVISLSNWSLKEGADAVIVVSPYYFKLTPDQIEEYYDRLAREIHGPLYIYNFPDRTGYTIPADVVKTLALRHKNIVGIKDTIPGMDHTRELIQAVKPVRPDFEIYSGFDENFAHNVLAGGDGCIAGLSNFAPSLCHQLAKAANEYPLSEYPIYCLFSGAGVSDGGQRQQFDAYQWIYESTPRLKTGINSFNVTPDGTHEWKVFVTEMYNALQIMFQDLE